MSETLVEALQLMIESTTSEINTSVPGKIVSYNPKTNRATVQPIIPKKLANGETLLPPLIHEVPIMFPASGMSGGKQAGIHLPIAPGDGVKLDFSNRSLENWLSGNNDAPDDPRQFDLSDCIATPGLNSSGFEGNGSDMVLRMGDTSLTIKPDGSFSVGSPGAMIAFDAGGNVTIKGASVTIETPARTFVLETHRHQEVTIGTEISGEPLP